MSITNPAETKQMYAAIRRCEEHEYIDTDTLDILMEESQKRAEADDKKLPVWAKDNPWIRISMVEINETRIVFNKEKYP